MVEEANPIEIANKSSVSLGDLVVINEQNVASISSLDGDSFTAQKGFEIYVRKYENSIILKQDRTGYLIGENLLKVR